MNMEYNKKYPIRLYSQSNYLEQAHHHIEYEILYIDKGSVEFGFEESVTVVHEGNVIFMHPGIHHYVKKIENTDYHYYSMVFDSSVLGNQGEPIRNTLDSIRVSRFIELPEEILIKFRDATVLSNEESFGYELFVKSVLLDIISYVLFTFQYVEISDYLRTEKGNTVNAIDVTLDYIRDHYRENIALDDVLKITTYSKSHFIRLFKKNMGMNLTDYINKYRIEKSCLDLIYTSKNVTEIATENGFNTVQYFSKIFKNYMGCTPKHYQRNSKRIIIPSNVTKIN